MAWSGTAACTGCTFFLVATQWTKRTAFQKRQDKQQLDEEGRLLQEYVIARASRKLSVWIQVSTCGCYAMHDTDQSFETLHLSDSLYNIANLQARRSSRDISVNRECIHTVRMYVVNCQKPSDPIVRKANRYRPAVGIWLSVNSSS